jgi:Fe-S cluster assembly scaffold protein SufB
LDYELKPTLETKSQGYQNPRTAFFQKKMMQAKVFVDINGWPEKHEEEWRYTNINHLKNNNYVWKEKPSCEICEAYLSINLGKDFVTNLVTNLPSNTSTNLTTESSTNLSTKLPINLQSSYIKSEIYLFNGHFLPGVSDRNLQKSGLICSTGWNALTEKFYSQYEFLKSYEEDFVSSYNFLHNPEPVIIEVEKDFQGSTLKVYNVELPGNFHHMVSTPHILLILNESSKLNLEMIWEGESYSSGMSVLNLFLHRGAELNFSMISKINRNASQIAVQNILLEKDAKLKSSSLVSGGILNRFEQKIYTLGSGTQVDLNYVYSAKEKEQVEINSRVFHKFPEGLSRQNIRGKLSDSARANINGKIFIDEGCNGVDSNMMNNNLLLSDFAEVNTKPELEIKSDDVKATHGATVGQLDSEIIFYLASRGINEKVAEKMFLKGFLMAGLGDVLPEDAEIKKYLEDIFEQ